MWAGDTCSRGQFLSPCCHSLEVHPGQWASTQTKAEQALSEASSLLIQTTWTALQGSSATRSCLCPSFAWGVGSHRS